MMVETTAHSMADHLECLCTHMRFFLAQAMRACHEDPDALGTLADMTDTVAVGLLGILCADLHSDEQPGLTAADLVEAFQPRT